MRLPRLGPVGLVDDPRPQLADRPQAERLEVPERLGDLGARRIAAPGRAPARGANRRWPGRIDARAEPLVDQLEPRLDARPAGRDAAEDLADRLDGLGIRLDRELEPGRPRLAPAPRAASATATELVPDLVEEPAAR